MKRSFGTDIETPDIRPTLLSLAALMLLLIPILLFIVNPQKTTSIPLSMSSASSIPPIAHSGPIENLQLFVDIDNTKLNQQKNTSIDYILGLEVERRKSDVRASQGDTERKRWNFQTVSDCLQKLRDIKSMDPSRERITVIPSTKLQTQDIVYWMDLLRQDEQGMLFPSVILQSSQLNTTESEDNPQ